MNAVAPRQKTAYWMPALLGEDRVMLIDFSADGLLLEHYRELPADADAVFLLEFEGERIATICRIVHCEKFPVSYGSSFSVYRTSVLFLDSDPEVERRIEAMIEARHQISIALQMANASGQGSQQPHPTFRNGLVAIDAGGEARRPEFMRMTFDGRRWTALCTTDGKQPANGFAVCVEELPQQIQRLCEAYENSTEEGRILIRSQARLTIEGRKKKVSRRGH